MARLLYAVYTQPMSSRVGGFRQTPDIDALTPFPVPWSYPGKDEVVKKQKYPKFKAKPYPKSDYTFHPPTFPPFPHEKNPTADDISPDNVLHLTSVQAERLSKNRDRLMVNGGTVQARLLLRPGEKITSTTNVYIAKVLTPKQAGTSYPVYILRVRPDAPQYPGRHASSQALDKYTNDLLKWQYRYDRAGYWDTVRYLKEKRADAVEEARRAHDKAVAQDKEQRREYYKRVAKARIEYERKVTEAKAKYRAALREYQISKIGSYYGNKYFSLYGSYYS